MFRIRRDREKDRRERLPEPLFPSEVPLLPLDPPHRAERLEAGEKDPSRPAGSPQKRQERSAPRQPRHWTARVIAEFATRHLRTEHESSLLLLMSIADLLMTYLLLRQGAVSAYEANPIARWWFARWNVAGLTAFKFLVVAVVIVACEIVERRRPGWGRAILLAGSLAAGVVFAYGVSLYAKHVIPGFVPGLFAP